MAYLTPTTDHPTARRDIGALVVAARSGDEQAFAALYGEFDPALARYLRARTGPDAVRLSARTWIALCLDLGRVPASREGFRTRLVHAAREQVEQLRPSMWHQPDPAVTRLLDEVELDAEGPTDFSPATITGDAAVGRLSDALSEEQLDMVLMAVVLDCTDGEIAALTGRTRPEIRSAQVEAGRTLEQAFGAVELFRLLERATQTTTAEPPPGLVAAMVRAANSTTTGRWAARAASAVAIKAAVAGVLVLGSATGAAAATGSLPDVAQDRIASLVSHVGLDLPDSGEASDTGTPDGGDAPEETPVDGPVDVAPPEGTHGAEVSDVARDTELQGQDKGQQVSDAARDGAPPHAPAPAQPPAGPSADVDPSGRTSGGPPAEPPATGGPPASPPGR